LGAIMPHGSLSGKHAARRRTRRFRMADARYFHRTEWFWSDAPEADTKSLPG